MPIEVPEILPPSSDIVFKMLFGTEANKDILKAFLRAVLPLPGDDYDDLTLLNPFVRNEVPEKESILDIQVKTRNDKRINIEIQMADHSYFQNRIVYYVTKVLAGQLKKGEPYDKLKPVIGLVITGFVLSSESLDYHDSYQLHSQTSGRIFSDLLRVDTLELPKLPELPSGGEPRVEWLSFLKAKDKKAMDLLAERNPDIEKAVSCLTHLSADDQARQRYEAHLKWQRDMWAYKKDAEEALEKGRAEGVQRVARRMLQRQRPIAEIMEDTGLSAAEIAALQ